MKHLAVILVVALVGAVGLWVLSELNNSSRDVATRVAPAENGQDTDFSSPTLGLSAQLPGKGWTEGAAPDGTGIWFNANKDLAFVVRPTGQDMPQSEAELGNDAATYVKNNLTGGVVDPQGFNSAPAYRVEGIGTAGPLQNYHCFGNVFTPQSHETVLLVCASPSAWDSDHRRAMSAILAGVVMK